MLVPFSVIPNIGLISEHTKLSVVKTDTDMCYLIKIKFVLSVTQHLLAVH